MGFGSGYLVNLNPRLITKSKQLINKNGKKARKIIAYLKVLASHTDHQGKLGKFLQEKTTGHS